MFQGLTSICVIFCQRSSCTHLILICIVNIFNLIYTLKACLCKHSFGSTPGSKSSPAKSIATTPCDLNSLQRATISNDHSEIYGLVLSHGI